MTTNTQLAAFNYLPNTNLVLFNISAAYTVLAADAGKIINSTANTYTISLLPAAAAGAGFNFTVWNNSATVTHVITIDPAGSETIDGKTTLILRIGEGMQIVCNGTNWDTGNKKVMRGYAENIIPSQSRANASGNLDVAIGAASSASGGSGIALGFDAQTTSASGTSIGANSGANGSRVATGSGAMALGGSYASGSNSFAAAVADNTSSYGAQGANSIAMGNTARAASASGIAIGNTVVASQPYSLSMGSFATASGAGAMAFGFNYNLGATTTASGADAIAFGDGARAAQTKKIAFAGWGAAGIGTAQLGMLVLTNTTTNATPTILTSDTAAASTTNQVILANNQAMVVRGQVIARQQVAGADKAVAWEFTGLIRRGTTAASTALVAAITPVSVAADATLATASFTVTADTTNGGLKIEVTGVAATNLRWVATVTSTEVIYA